MGDTTTTAEHLEKQFVSRDGMPAPLTAVAEALSRLRYGAVHLTIHDGRVVQLDVTERKRFT